MPEEKKDLRYAGFWVRLLALVIDAIIISIVFMPILTVIFPTREVFSNYYTQPGFRNTFVEDPATSVRGFVFMIYAILMLNYYGATLGKRLLGIKVVSENGKRPSILDLIIRESIGKFLSTIVLGLGFILAGFDKKKQGWHDKLAKTVVVYDKRTSDK